MVLTTVRDSSTIARPQQLEGTYSAIPGAYYNSAPAGMVGNATGPYAVFGPAQVKSQILGSTALGSTARYLGAGAPNISPLTWAAQVPASAGRGAPTPVTFAGQTAQVGSLLTWNAVTPAIDAANQNGLKFE